jgi:hypothetical protein
MRTFVSAVLLTIVFAAVGAYAQAPAPAPSATPDPKPATPAPQPSVERKAVAASPVQSLVGKDAFSSDGSRVGDVRAVKTAPDGRVTALLLRTGGFLGFGGRMVEVPEGRFKPSNQDVRLDMTAEEAGKLPEVKDGT